MLPRLSFRALALAILVTFTCHPAAADMLINPGSPAVDQRFFPSPTNLFWAASYNLTGIGNTNGTAGNGQWVTAISANYGLTASHYAAAGNVTFVDSTGTSVTTAINGSVAQLGGSDLELVRFATPLPSTVATYAIAANNEASLMGASIMSVGVPWAVGRNTIAGFGTESIGASTGSVLTYNWDPSAGVVSDLLQSGDSGGPTFTYGPDGSMFLVGLHWYIGGTLTGQQDSGDTFVPAYLSQIAAAELLLPTTSVPEPSSLALLGIGLASVFGVIKRQRAIK